MCLESDKNEFFKLDNTNVLFGSMKEFGIETKWDPETNPLRECSNLALFTINQKNKYNPQSNKVFGLLLGQLLEHGQRH